MTSQQTPVAETLYCPTCEHTFAAGELCPSDGSPLVSLVAQRDPFVGRDLDGRYVVGDRLGQGGMGAVYRGTQTSVGRDVAIKVVNPISMGDPEIIKRFLREAKLASKLNHPNAVSVVDFGQTRDGVFYLVMELIRGRTLAEIVAAEQRLAPERVIAIGAQILRALEGAHAIPIVHRDLKPANIMVTNDDVVKVLDFGIAKSISPHTVASTMTNAGALLGTPHFMPPEIASGDTVDGRADLYSLGCILYLLIEGHLPFEGDSLPDLLQQHANSPVPPFAHAPRELARAIARLLAKQPAQRFPSATVARTALEHALVDPSPSHAHLPATLHAQMPARATKPRWPLLVGVAAAIVVGVGAALAIGGGGSAVPDVPAAPIAPTTVAAPTPASTPTPTPAPVIAAPTPDPAPVPTKPAAVSKPTSRAVRPSPHATPTPRPATTTTTKSATKPATDPPPPF